jgi:nanoRNase/pAp phosphatase (c-di-AMP/oligoRNAs hydrolase)
MAAKDQETPSSFRNETRWSSRKEALRELHSLVNTKDRVLITIDPDPDSISSALALKRLLWHKVQSTTIGQIRPIKRLNNLTMVRLLKLPLVQLNKGKLKEFTKFLLVDGQPSHNDFFQTVDYTAVIDHHPLKDGGPQAAFVDIRPSYGATATMLTEYLRAAQIKPSQGLATALIYGIKTDTQNFERKSREEDVKAFRHLYPLANHNILRKIEISDLSIKDLKIFQRALEKKKRVKDRLFAHLDEVPSPDILVVIADFLLKVHDISWSIVSGIHQGKLIIIVRNDGYRKDAGRAVSRAFGELGSAGGHKAMARAEIPMEKVKSALNNDKSNAIENFVRKRLTH